LRKGFTMLNGDNKWNEFCMIYVVRVGIGTR